MDRKVILFSKKEDCCGCGACMNICPKQAISMQPDEMGFLYPVIDEDICVNCGACKNVCAYQNGIEMNAPLNVYAAARRDADKIVKSASGGIFSVLAEKVIEEGGVVFGAALQYEENKLIPRHIRVESFDELHHILGSKYVQSEIGNTYSQAKQCLKEGRIVLFSGTPCQIAGLKGYLGEKYENLLTVDVICHGVPNAEFFSAYIKMLEQKYGAEIVDFKFRDKTAGWGLNGCISLKEKNGNIEKKYISSEDSSYYSMFLSSEIYRKNCYSCKYTCKSRAGDITLGDYWGIQKEHPELLAENGGRLDEKKGISVVLVNTEQGEKWYNVYSDDTDSYISEFDKAAKINTQLREPSKYSKHRKNIMARFAHDDFSKVDKYYKSVMFGKKIREWIRTVVPKSVRDKLKMLIKWKK